MGDSCLPPLALVLGGAASGKSAFAERLILSAACRPRYVATMRRSDDPETGARIRRHQIERGPEWSTSEVPLDVASQIERLGDGAGGRPGADAALVDCATLWLANVLEAGRDPEAEGAALAEALGRASVPVVVVSNELGLGMVPMDAGARAFRDAHGRMNQALAARADLVVLVSAGLPLVLKGTLPE